MARNKDPYRFFKIEAQELIEQLNAGFLKLEENSEDASLLNELFRAAHTLKGSARLVKLPVVGEIGHAMEDLLGAARNEGIKLQPDKLDQCLRALDKVQEVLDRINRGEDPHLDAAATLVLLKGESAAPHAPSAPKATETPTSPPIQQQETGEAAASETEQLQQKLKSDQVKTAPPAADHHTTTLAGEDKPEPNPMPQSNPLFSKDKLPERASQPAQPANNAVSSFKQPRSADTVAWKTQSPEQPAANKSFPSNNHAGEETIRISLKRLNTLLNLSGELVINRTKLQDKVNQLNELKALNAQNEKLLEQWSRVENFPEFKALLAQSSQFQQAYNHLQQSTALQRQVKQDLERFQDSYEDDVKLTHFISLGIRDEAFRARMLPAEVMLAPFRRLVRDLGKELGKEIDLVLEGERYEVDKQILDEMKGPLMHLIRNSIDHGIEVPEERIAKGKPEKGRLTISLEPMGNSLVITCQDDGAGLDTQSIRQQAIKRKIITPQQAEEMPEHEFWYLIMAPGFSTAEIVSEISGRGVGMDVVSTAVSRLRGNITIQSESGSFTRFIIQLPQSLSNLPCLLFSCSQEKLLLPLSCIVRTLRIKLDELETEGNQEVINVSGKATPLVRLNQILKLKDEAEEGGKISVIVVRLRDETVAFAVNKLLGVHDVVVKDLGDHIEKVPNVGGATILGDGHPIIILDPVQLLKHSKDTSQRSSFAVSAQESNSKEETPILVVDDSLTTRMLEKSILESAGYEVEVAVNGEDALEKSQRVQYSLVITDIEMPRMNGFELIKALKMRENYRDVPMIIVSSLANADVKRRGIEAGAQGYIVKGEFDQKNLLDIIESLI